MHLIQSRNTVDAVIQERERVNETPDGWRRLTICTGPSQARHGNRQQCCRRGEPEGTGVSATAGRRRATTPWRFGLWSDPTARDRVFMPLECASFLDPDARE
jgi:hypothetical protein